MGYSDSQAAEIISRALPSASPGERMVVQAISKLESQYGSGWGGAGVGSNNWGAITGTGPAGYFVYKDSRPDPKDPSHQITYTTKFRRYNSPEDGAADVGRIALKPNVRDAIERRDLEGVSRAMRENKYYLGFGTKEQAIKAHAKRMRQLVDKILDNTGAKDPFALSNIKDPVQPADGSQPTVGVKPQPAPPAAQVVPRWTYYVRQFRAPSTGGLQLESGWLGQTPITQAQALPLILGKKPATYLATTTFNPDLKVWTAWEVVT